jgi:DNA replication protein DnaC
MQTISEAAATLQFINQTQRSVFLTGKAGTGKTTLLK